MVIKATRARAGEGGSAGAGPQVPRERGGAEERQSQVKTQKMIIYVCNVTQCGETLTLFLFSLTEPIQSITTIQATKTHLPASALLLPSSPPKVTIMPLPLRLHCGTQLRLSTPPQTPAENSTLLHRLVGRLQD